MHPMTRAYLACALFVGLDRHDEPLDIRFAIDDLSPEVVLQAEQDCMQFLEEHKQEIGTKYEQAGHDFMLTRNYHGSGFWDGDWPAEVGKRLTQAAHECGEVDLYEDDTAQLYWE